VDIDDRCLHDALPICLYEDLSDGGWPDDEVTANVNAESTFSDGEMRNDASNWTFYECRTCGPEHGGCRSRRRRRRTTRSRGANRSEEHTSELQSRFDL